MAWDPPKLDLPTYRDWPGRRQGAAYLAPVSNNYKFYTLQFAGYWLANLPPASRNYPFEPEPIPVLALVLRHTAIRVSGRYV